jgi:hypothetical protein
LELARQYATILEHLPSEIIETPLDNQKTRTGCDIARSLDLDPEQSLFTDHPNTHQQGKLSSRAQPLRENLTACFQH